MKNRYSAFALLTLLILVIGCKSEQRKNDDTIAVDHSYYKEKGKEIATATFSVLSANLQKAINNGGIQEAINYCNLAASPLVDSLSAIHNASIRRTSFLTRNPNNNPNEEEKKVLGMFRDQSQTGETLKPIIQESENEVSFYAPIMVNNFCLQCHGSFGNTLKEENYNIIKTHYPDDKATGYDDGDLRGMWSISFRKSD